MTLGEGESFSEVFLTDATKNSCFIFCIVKRHENIFHDEWANNINLDKCGQQTSLSIYILFWQSLNIYISVCSCDYFQVFPDDVI